MPASAGSRVNVFLKNNNTLLATTYCIHVFLSKPKKIKIGKLGTFLFQRGNYIYVGSAKKNITKRIERHLRKNKKKFWHIDYLLQYAKIEEIWVRNDYFDECLALSEAKKLLKNSRFPLKKFGSSDCRCPSHLIYLPENEADLESLREKVSFEKVDIHGI